MSLAIGLVAGIVLTITVLFLILYRSI